MKSASPISLIHRLGSMRGLVVRPLSATRKYADIEQDPIAAGKEQQVEYVLASNYQMAGGKIRITSQLFNVTTGQIEETYKSEKEAGDVFQMQDAIAGEVGELLQSRFVVTSGTSAENHGTKIEEAYRLYLQAMYLVDKEKPADSKRAIELFDEALALDPNYAKAWANKARAHCHYAHTGGNSPDAEYAIAKPALERAFALDNNLAEAHAVLAFLLVALFCYLANYGARANCLNPLWIGSVGGGTISVSGGPPNTTVYYDFTESNPGLVIYATDQFGAYSNSLHLPVVLNGAGSGSAHFYFKPVQVGQTTETVNSPQLGDWIYSGCTYNVLQPASTVSVIQYLKNGVYVDVPNPLTVEKGDTVTFKAIPSPAGSVFYYSNGPVDPSWSGSSGATGVGETTAPLLFDTASSNNHDYKTVIASVQNGGSYTANVLVVNGVQSVTIDKIDPATEFNDNPNTGGGKRVFPDKNDPSDTVDRKRVRVTALTSLPSKKTIYFKSFDLDDPSANAAPIDTNGSVGDDNRGGVGTPAHAGLLSPVGGTGTTNSASAKTDTSGNASVDLVVTMQAGDNFMVAASDDLTYLNALTVNQILLQDSGGNIVGSGTPKAKASPMLTVWRRVHVEVDSMDVVPTTAPWNNHVSGHITEVNGTTTNEPFSVFTKTFPRRLLTISIGSFLRRTRSVKVIGT
jgi:hypothetical protein